MNLEIQLETQALAPVPLAAANDPPCRLPVPRARLPKPIALLACASLLLSVAGPLNLQGEEKGRYEDAATRGPLWTSIIAPSVASAAADSREPVPPPSLVSRAEPVGPTYTTQPTPILDPPQPSRDARGPEVGLLRVRLSSRDTPSTWARVNASYGQFFDRDRIGRSRTSGVGLQDKDWVYVKMIFKF